jgi:hypothetical protein
MSLENMYRVHLDSVDKQVVYREKRGCYPCKLLLHFMPPAETGSEKRFAMHAGVALRDLCGQGPTEACFPPGPVAGCWIYFIYVTVMGMCLSVRRQHE